MLRNGKMENWKGRVLSGNEMIIPEMDNIQKLVNSMAMAVKPLKIYLFGSFATGDISEDSDYDFYIIVGDNREETILDLTTDAYKSIRGMKNRPVDILANRESTFEKRKDMILSVEQEVYRKGKVIYDATL